MRSNIIKTMCLKFELLRENENKAALWCILRQFELMIWTLELLRNIESKNGNWCIFKLHVFETMFLEVGTAEKILKNKDG